MRMHWRRLIAFGGAAAMLANSIFPVAAAEPDFHGPSTATPIKHLVVIYDENISFDHYFATYPHATNPPEEPRFFAAPFTPKVNNLVTADLLTNNPNFTNTANGAGAANPFRLDRTQAATADQNHSYTPEQQAFDGGKADLFPKYTGAGTTGGAGAFGTTGQVMGYYDGNTVTALWNYAQHFAMSDNAYGSSYGPSTPGALEAISGQTNGYVAVVGTKSSAFVADGAGGFTDIGDEDPANDVCSSKTQTMSMLGKNIGDLLNEHGISWGGFMGGFDLSLANADGTTGCARDSTSAYTGTTADYVPHHNWFQYYASTANPTHARPNSVAAIGHTRDAYGQLDPANHEYDVNDFYAAVKAGNFPAVAFLKAPAFQDGHAGYSDPLDEQTWIVQVVNFIERSPEWRDTAILIDYDDSDGWYDHAFVEPTNASYSTADELNGAGMCGSGPPLPGLGGDPVYGRCGPGVRMPFLVISPYAKANYVSHSPINQSSIIRFIEDNWLGGERLNNGSFDAATGSIANMFDFNDRFHNSPLFLDAQEGTPAGQSGNGNSQ